MMIYRTLLDFLRSSKLTLFGQVFPAIYRIPFVGYFAKGQYEDMIAGVCSAKCFISSLSLKAFDLQLRRVIKEDVDKALKSYSTDQEPECLAQAYCQKMDSNPNLK